MGMGRGRGYYGRHGRNETGKQCNVILILIGRLLLYSV